MENLLKIIVKEYSISISHMEQLNIGFDINTSIYKLFSEDKKIYFLKIRSGNFNESCMSIPYILSKEMKFKNLIDPIKTLENKLFVKMSPYYLMLFPYVNGQSGWNVSLSKDQFVEFGEFMNNLHSTNILNKYTKNIITENYNEKYRENVKNIMKNIKNKNHGNSVIMDFSNCLQDNKKIIIEMIRNAENIIKEMVNEDQKMCLCHGDIHAGNILIDNNDFYIVDWDTITLAPKEKDLMFIGGGIGDKWNQEKEVEYFYAGYGNELSVDKKLIKYYRCERIIQDIYEFYQQIMDKNTDEEERKLCLEIFKKQFEKNNVVEIAMKT
jgi:spectinomycin phosphotransferase